MIAGFLLMVAGAGIARFSRRQRWWLKAHKTMGSTGAFLILLGLAAGFLMVGQSDSGHIRAPHSWIGLLMIILSLVTPYLGMLQFKIPARAKRLKPQHRWAGRITLIVGAVTIFTGLLAAGII